MRIAKKVLSVILAMLMAFGTFAALPFTVSAETKTTVPNDSDINVQSDTTLTGTASNTRVTVTANCTIVLDGLTLTNTSNNGKCGIDVQSGTVNLIIKGTNNSPLVSYTKISPHKNVNRNHKIDTITIHCVVGQCSVETLGSVFSGTRQVFIPFLLSHPAWSFHNNDNQGKTAVSPNFP
ncbi:MAG: hypothetical protein IJT44_03790 [Clostridia bacterium]|nr:hypothetical protein [Clostridia bacterium]